MYKTRLQEIRQELQAEDPGKLWHKLAWELLSMVENSEYQKTLLNETVKHLAMRLQNYERV